MNCYCMKSEAILMIIFVAVKMGIMAMKINQFHLIHSILCICFTRKCLSLDVNETQCKIYFM